MELMTREELHQAYLDSIEELENMVSGLKYKKSRIDVEIEHKLDRIQKLKETAKMYESEQVRNKSLVKEIADKLQKMGTYK